MIDKVIHTKVKAVWDIETADRCRLPELLPDICKRCRCDKYCHSYKQQTWSDFLRGDNNEQR